MAFEGVVEQITQQRQDEDQQPKPSGVVASFLHRIGVYRFRRIDVGRTGDRRCCRTRDTRFRSHGTLAEKCVVETCVGKKILKKNVLKNV